MKRSLLFLLPLFPIIALTQTPQLVINEVDYDQPSTDEAEFIEIKNIGVDPVQMQSISVDLINGASGGSAVYLTLEDPTWPVLLPGEYFVICGNAGNTVNCDADVQPDANLVQNGSPDAIALRSGLNILDMLSYEGSVPGFTEVSGDSLVDPTSGGVGGSNQYKSLSRIPDGADSNNNNADFQVACSTPGEANVQDTSNCTLATAIVDPGLPVDNIFSYLLPQQNQLMFTIEQAVQGKLVLALYDVSGKLLYSDERSSSRNWSGAIPLGQVHGQIVLFRVITESASKTQRVWIP